MMIHVKYIGLIATYDGSLRWVLEVKALWRNVGCHKELVSGGDLSGNGVA